MNQKGLILVLGTALISGFSIFINKYSVSIINPYIFTFLKNLIVAILFCGLIIGLKDWQILKKLTKKQWGLLLIIGLVGGSIPFLLFFKGLSLTNSAQGALIHKTMFIYVAILAFVFLKEKIEKKFLFGGLLLILGNLLVLKNFSFSLNQGVIFIFLATFLWSIENILSKYTLKEVSGRIVGWGRMFFGSFFILAFLFASDNQLALISNLNIKQVFWIIITSVILFGYVITWYSGLKHILVSKATVILSLGSPITTFLYLISGGAVNAKEILAGILIVLGVMFIILTWKQFFELSLKIRRIYVRA